MREVAQIAWLAGILEGEGCFRVHRGRYPEIEVAMSDRDVIERAASIFTDSNAKVRAYTDKRDEAWKEMFRFSWYGSTAVEVMHAVLPFMGERRSAKIRKCLEAVNDTD